MYSFVWGFFPPSKYIDFLGVRLFFFFFFFKSLEREHSSKYNVQQSCVYMF